jgi:hypothetical protein
MFSDERCSGDLSAYATLLRCGAVQHAAANWIAASVALVAPVQNS